MLFKTTVNCLSNDIWCYLVIGCFDWKIGVFQQTVRVYCIINVPIQSTCQTLPFNESCLTYIYTKMVHFHMGCTKRMKTFFNLNNTRIPNSITKFCKVTQRVLLGDIGQFTFSPFSWRSEKVFRTQHFLFFFGSWKLLHTKSKQTKSTFNCAQSFFLLQGHLLELAIGAFVLHLWSDVSPIQQRNR